MVKRRFNNLRAGIANNTRVPPKTPKKSLYELRERAKKIVETAKKTPEEQPIISKKHDLRVKPPPSTPCLPAKMILMSMACFQNILSTFQSGHSGECQRKITVETTVQKGIRNFVKLKCECGYSSGDYSMPPGSNYAFCHSIKSNGLSKTKINNFISI